MWRIKTNTGKFKVIPPAIRKTQPITINGDIIPYTNESNILELSFNKLGIAGHIKNNKNKTLAALTSIKRFNNLLINIKLHLVKACVLPVFEKPPYPQNAISRTSLLTLQKIQNKAIRFALEEKYPFTKNTEELHQQANIEALNVKICERAIKTNNSLTNILRNTTYIDSIDDVNNKHGWFKKAGNSIKQR